MPLIYCLGAHQALKQGWQEDVGLPCSSHHCLFPANTWSLFRSPYCSKNTQLLGWRSWFAWENVSLRWKKCWGWSISLLADVGWYLQEDFGE